MRKEDVLKIGILGGLAYLLLRLRPSEAEQPPEEQPECTEGETKCEGYDYYMCENGRWVLVERNSRLCGYEETPQPPPHPPEEQPPEQPPEEQPECNEGETRCEGHTLYECRNGTWVKVKDNAPECGYEIPHGLDFTLDELMIDEHTPYILKPGNIVEDLGSNVPDDQYPRADIPVWLAWMAKQSGYKPIYAYYIVFEDGTPGALYYAKSPRGDWDVAIATPDAEPYYAVSLWQWVKYPSYRNRHGTRITIVLYYDVFKDRFYRIDGVKMTAPW